MKSTNFHNSVIHHWQSEKKSIFSLVQFSFNWKFPNYIFCACQLTNYAGKNVQIIKSVELIRNITIFDMFAKHLLFHP